MRAGGKGDGDVEWNFSATCKNNRVLFGHEGNVLGEARGQKSSIGLERRMPVGLFCKIWGNQSFVPSF